MQLADFVNSPGSTKDIGMFEKHIVDEIDTDKKPEQKIRKEKEGKLVRTKQPSKDITEFEKYHIDKHKRKAGGYYYYLRKIIFDGNKNTTKHIALELTTENISNSESLAKIMIYLDSQTTPDDITR